nr:uncharacterized protein LOC110383721 [Helicoverpa armigera]
MQGTKNNTSTRIRGENWTQEEKDLFFEIMRESAHIVDIKSTDTDSNRRKKLEWLNVQNKLKELTGKPRDVPQLKGFWRRFKMATKESVPQHQTTSLEDYDISREGETVTVTADVYCKENYKVHPPTPITNKTQVEKKITCKTALPNSNFKIKKRAMEMMEEEHELKIKYQQQELAHQELKHRMEIELYQLDKTKKELEIELLKKKLKE